MSWYKLKTDNRTSRLFLAGTNANNLELRYGYIEGSAHSGGTFTNNYCHIEGYKNSILIGVAAHVEGSLNTGNDDCCHIHGRNNLPEGGYFMNAHIEGDTVYFPSNSQSQQTHSEGYLQRIEKGGNMFITGYNNVVKKDLSTTIDNPGFIGGCNQMGGAGNFGMFGCNNNCTDNEDTGWYFGQGLYASNKVLVIGYGGTHFLSTSYYPSEGVFTSGGISTTGADYAEMFEWADGNPDNEDRVGHFVTLCDGNKIRYAEKGEKPIGVVSATPAVLGDNKDIWKDKYVKDDFGRILTNDEYYTYEKNGEDKEKKIERPIVSQEYNENLIYTPRDARPEWDAIGFMGKLRVYDDGTCEVGGKCTVGDGGIATAGDDFYVIERIDENIITVLGKFL